MKKISLAFILVLFVITSVDAKNIKIHRRGSTDGIHYDKVTETHGLFSHTLSCTNPGAIQCGWAAVAPTIGGYSATDIENWVLTQLSNGINSGSTRYNNEVYVTWTYNVDTDELDITMSDDF